MARIVYVNHGMVSPLNTGLELARRLRARGHDIAIISPRDVRSRVEGAGFEFHRIDEDRSFVERWERATSDRERRAIRQESIRNDETERVVTSLGAELLLIDIELHHAVIATAHLGIPILLTINWFSIFKTRRNPPLHTSMLPAESLRDRLGVELAWLRLWAAYETRLLRKRLRRKTAAGMNKPAEYESHDISNLKAVARTRGWDFRRSTSRWHWLRPMLYTDIEILCFNAEELDFPGAGHPNLHYVGPMVDPQRVETRLDGPSRKRLEAFLVRSSDSEDRPLVYCSLGTYSDTHQDFLARVVDVFARRADWDLVLGLGDKSDAARFGDVPENVLILPWAPQLEVLAHADCMITHAGISSINESISSGVPLLAYSTKEVDRNGCAARIHFHGLGIAADKDIDGVEEIEANLRRILHKPRFRENVRVMCDRFARYQSSHKAERLIESKLRR